MYQVLPAKTYNHYIAYDENGDIVYTNDSKIAKIEVSRFCRRVAGELLLRLQNANFIHIDIHMKESGDELSIESISIEDEEKYILSGGIYDEPIELNNIYALAHLVINYESNRIATLYAKDHDESGYDDGIFDEQLIMMQG